MIQGLQPFDNQITQLDTSDTLYPVDGSLQKHSLSLTPATTILLKKTDRNGYQDDNQKQKPSRASTKTKIRTKLRTDNNGFNSGNEVQRDTTFNYKAKLSEKTANIILGKHGPHTTTLDLTRYIENMSKETLVHVLREVQHCNTLIIKEWNAIDIINLRTLAISIGNRLREINLTSSLIDDNGLKVISLHLINVEKISLCNCPNVSAYGVRDLTFIVNKKLNSFDISKCRKISKEAITWISGTAGGGTSKCSKLNCFNISECNLINDNALLALINHPSIQPQAKTSNKNNNPYLMKSITKDLAIKNVLPIKYLNLSYCDEITDFGVKHLVCGLNNFLEVLNMEGCKHISDKSLFAIGKNCQNLKSLSVARCNAFSISDCGVITLINGCHKLHSLNLAGARFITEKVLAYIATTSKHISTLNINGCEQITRNGLLAIIQGLRYVQEATSFIGFIPKPNANYEKVADQELLIEEVAVLRFQNTFIKKCNKKWGRGYHFRLRLNLAASIIQKVYRKHAKRSLYNTVNKGVSTTNAVIVIQKHFKGYKVRKEMAVTLMIRKEYAKRTDYAITLQRVYRGYRTRTKNKIMYEDGLNKLLIARQTEVRSAAAVYIQAIVRSRIAKKKVKAKRAIQARRKFDEDEARRILACTWRSYKAVRLMKELRRQNKIKEFIANRNARLIQVRFYIHKGIQGNLTAIREREAENRRRNRAAAFLQRIYRGKQARQEFWKKLVERQIQNTAATMIQKVFRSNRVLRWCDIKMNKLGYDVWNYSEMENIISYEKIKTIQKKSLSNIRTNDLAALTEDNEADDCWTQSWNESEKRWQYYNSLLDKTLFESPESRFYYDEKYLHKEVRVFWPAEQEYYDATITGFNREKRLYKLEYTDGDMEYVSLVSDGDRIMFKTWDNNNEEKWVMASNYTPPEIEEEKRIDRRKREIERQNERLLLTIKEWVDVIDEKREIEEEMEAEDELLSIHDTVSRQGSLTSKSSQLSFETSTIDLNISMKLSSNGSIANSTSNSRNNSFQKSRSRLSSFKTSSSRASLKSESVLSSASNSRQASFVLGSNNLLIAHKSSKNIQFSDSKLPSKLQELALSIENENQEGNKYPSKFLQNMRTGEIRRKAKDASDWKLATDKEGCLCWKHLKYRSVSYTDPRFAREDGLTPRSLSRAKKICREEIQVQAYLLQDLFERFSKIVNTFDDENNISHSSLPDHVYITHEKSTFFKTFSNYHYARNLGKQLALMKSYLGETLFGQDKYCTYARELLKLQYPMDEYCEEYLHRLDLVKFKTIGDKTLRVKTVQCQNCQNDISKTENFCPYCGAKM